MTEGYPPISEHSHEESDSPVKVESSISDISLLKVTQSLASKLSSEIQQDQFAIDAQSANKTVIMTKYLEQADRFEDEQFYL